MTKRRGEKTLSILENNGRCYSIKIVKNQKIVIARRRHNSISFADNREAAENLSTNAYTLYMNLIMNQNNKAWALSSKYVIEKTGLTKNTYPAAVNELINKGYMVASQVFASEGVWSEGVYELYESLAYKAECKESVCYPENQVS